MADQVLLGLFHEATSTAATIDALRALGVPDQHIAVMSGTPYRPEVLGRSPAYERLVPIALVGALGGLLTGLFLTVGVFLLYPLVVGGQPIIPIPPTLIILFELTMLGTMYATFGGLLAESRFPFFGLHAYDHRVTEGHIGVLVRVDDSLADRAEQVLKEQGAHHLQRRPARARAQRHPLQRWALIGAVLVIPTLIVLALAYAIVIIPLPDQMVEQASIAYEQGPRLAAPGDAVPVQGPDLIDGQPATGPVSPTAQSLQRGSVLFQTTCVICHGERGTGDGTLAHFFSPPPADLTSAAVQALPDADIFVVITQGRGAMPPLAENLLPGERWDVVNYVRSLRH